MPDTDRRAELIAGIERERLVWRDLVAEVGVDRMTEPRPMGSTRSICFGHLHDEHLPSIRTWLATHP